jgi:hypothetical protein
MLLPFVLTRRGGRLLRDRLYTPIIRLSFVSLRLAIGAHLWTFILFLPFLRITLLFNLHTYYSRFCLVCQGVFLYFLFLFVVVLSAVYRVNLALSWATLRTPLDNYIVSHFFRFVNPLFFIIFLLHTILY